MFQEKSNASPVCTYRPLDIIICFKGLLLLVYSLMSGVLPKKYFSQGCFLKQHNMRYHTENKKHQEYLYD